MPGRKMLILRGNAAAAGTYPDESGAKIAWPFGALHVAAATEYARQTAYEPIVLNKQGWPQGETSPQASAALDMFLNDPDQAITAFYGFSGGGYNLYHILNNLASDHPDALHRVRLVVVLGAPKRLEFEFESSKFNAIAESRLARKDRPNWRPVRWDVVWRSNPPKSALPKGLPDDTETHMFGPDVLLAQRPAGIGRYRDWPVDDDC